MSHGLAVLAVLAASVVLGAAAAYAQSGSSGSRFYFPRFYVTSRVSTGIAIFNPSGAEATVTLTLRDFEGQSILKPATVKVPAIGQVSKTSSELFGVADIDASLEVSSATPGLVVYYQAFDFDSTFSDGAPAPDASQELIFPVLPARGEGDSEIDLLNTNNRTAAVDLRLWALDGTLLSKTTVTVDPGGIFAGIPARVFPNSTDFSRASHVTASSRALNLFSQAQTVSGTSLFYGFSSAAGPGGTYDLAGLNALTQTQTGNSGVLPFFHTGPKYASTLALANVEPASVDVTLTAIGNNGVTLGTRRVTLAANGGYRAPVESTFSTLGFADREGWILLSATGRVTASLIYGRADAPALTAAPLQPRSSRSLVFPHLVQGFGYKTEVTLSNPGSSASNVELYLVTPQGRTVDKVQVVVPASGRVSRTLDQLISNVPAQSGGYVYVRASEPLFGVATVWSDSGATASSFAGSAPSSTFVPPPQTRFTVSGTVTLNDSPAEGFRVVLSGSVSAVATTGADGTYSFTGLPAGRYSMSVDQSGLQFAPSSVSFEITTENRRQDFKAVTEKDAIIVSPAGAVVRSPDVTATVFGTDFNSSSEAFVDAVRLTTTFVDRSQLRIVVPAHMLTAPTRFDIFVVTNPFGPSRRVSKSFTFTAYQNQPILTVIEAPDNLVEGAQGTSISLRGAGFLAGAKVKVNGGSDGITVTVVDDSQITAFLPSRYFVRGGIFPVTVENPYPANAESNVQLLTVYHPAPAVQELLPKVASVRLEDGAGGLDIEVLGFGFRRGARVLMDGVPLVTTYCEQSAYCLSVHLYAKIPAASMRRAGYAKITVENPDPSLSVSEEAFLRIEGLQPTIESVSVGSASVLPGGGYVLPVVVNGANFGLETTAEIYTDTSGTGSAVAAIELVSSHQIVVTFAVTYSSAPVDYYIAMANPQPGGGVSERIKFTVNPGNYVSSPFLTSLLPETVAAGGPAFTLVVNGTNFIPGSQIVFYSTFLVTTVISDRQVRAEVPASLIQFGGRYPVVVVNPDNGGSSNRLYVDVR
jgi:hypothetical protein